MGNKTIIGLIILTLGIIFYYSFIKDPTALDDSSLVARDNQVISAESLGREIIQSLARIEKISLDTKMFGERGYKRLNNLNQIIPEQDPGKNSPFDPIDQTFFTGIRNVNPIDVADAIESGEVSPDSDDEDSEES